ncbi:MAG: DUF4827 family protein [Parabacteroides sp.]|nr:DUF4827 family protein [Parabacteroides sp.]
MKKGFYFLMIMCAILVGASCGKTASYTDMLKAEEKAIERLRADSGYVFLDEWPKDSIFKDNEFVKLENGVYLNIIDRGNSDRAVIGKTEIQTRFVARLFMETSDLGTGVFDLLGPHSAGTHPIEFKYGYFNAGLYDYVYNIFISPGLASGLPFVGDTSFVKMIVPFRQMGSMGDFQTYGTPVYFEKVRYIFKK